MSRPRDDADLDALHDVRIRAKRLRYALELLRPALGHTHRSLRPLLKRVQSTIGEHREAAQLADCLQERRTKLVDKGLHTLASALDPVVATALHRRQLAFEAAMQAFEALVEHCGGPTIGPPR